MPISKYPRKGHSLAPSLLADVLPPDLRGLDETAWKTYKQQECQRFAGAIVLAIRVAIPQLPENVLKRKIPEAPDGKQIDSLTLELRTWNCIRKTLDPKSTFYGRRRTVGEVLSISGFGALCLVDLLTSIESSKPLGSKEQSLGQMLARRLKREVKKLAQLRFSRTITRRDPRLGPMIRSLSHSAKNIGELVEQLLNPPPDMTELEVSFSRVRELRTRTLVLHSMTLEDELVNLSNIMLGNRNGQILILRAGWDGKGVRTLQEVGDAFGLTRERARQICQKATRGLQRTTPFAPALDRTLRLISKQNLVPADLVEAQIALKGLAKAPMQLESIDIASRIFGRKQPFSIVELNGKRIVTATGMEDLPKLAIQVACKSIRRWGLSTVVDLRARLSEVSGHALPETKIIGFLELRPDFKWIDRDSGWFTLAPLASSRLRTIVEKVLSVAGSINVGELRSAIGRSYAMDGFAPPRRMLLEVCRSIASCRVENESVFAESSIKGSEILSKTEQAIVRLFKENGPALQKSQVQDLAHRYGVNTNTLSIYLQYSPVVQRYALGIFGAVGTPVPPGLIDSIALHPKQGKLIVDYGWLASNKIWVEYCLTKSTIATGLLSIPGPMSQHLTGSFRIRSQDGSDFGALKCKSNNAWGLQSFLRRMGGDVGDSMTILFDLQNSTVVVQIGSDFTELTSAERVTLIDTHPIDMD